MTSRFLFDFTIVEPSRKKYGPFSDKFMYRYLSLLLASMQPPPALLGTYNSTTQNPHSHDRTIAPVLNYVASAASQTEVIYSFYTNETTDMFNNGSVDLSWFELNKNQSSLDRFPCDNCSTVDPENGNTVAIIVAGTLLSLVTAGGNVMVMIAFKLERQLQTISNYFLLSLAAADLTIGLISIPLMTYYTARGEWDLGYTTCQCWLSIDYLMCNASVLNLLLISFDRYFSVTQPLTYRPRRTSKKAMIMIASTFVVSLLLWPPLIVFWPHIEGVFNVADNECIVQFLRTNPAVTLGTATLAFYGPVIIMVVLYSRVYYVTRTRQRELIKLQAFHQKSIKRTISTNSDGRIPLRATLSTTSSSVVGGHKISTFSKTLIDVRGIESELGGYTTVYANNNNNHANNRSSPNASRSVSRATLRRLESDPKPWGFQALLEHFSRPRPIESAPSTRRASFASSGFEEEESFSAGSGDTTTYVGEESLPLRGPISQRTQRQLHRAASQTPSDYGSTLASQFVNYVRQSFSVRRKSKIELGRIPSIQPTNRSRSMSTPYPTQGSLIQMAEALSNPQRYYQKEIRNQKILESPPPAGTPPAPAPPPPPPPPPPPEQRRHKRSSRRGTYDPTNSPLPELRRLSTVSRISSKCAAATATRSAPTPILVKRLQATNEEEENETSALLSATQTRSVSTPAGSSHAAVYSVLIKLGKSPNDQSPNHRSGSPQIHAREKRKISREKPVITVYANPSVGQTSLSPDRAASGCSSLSPGGSGSAQSPSIPVYRLSSNSSAASDPESQLRSPTPFIGSGKLSRSSGTPSPISTLSRSCLSRQGVNRLSSNRSGYTESTTGASVIATNSIAPSGGNRSCRRRRRGERRYQESKAARTLSAILLAFIITWAPYNVIVCIESFHQNYVPVFWFTLSYYLCYLNSAINPLLYALCNPTFRRTFWRIMTFRWAQFKSHHRRRSPHHQAAVALTAVAIATANRHTKIGGSLK